MSAFGRGVLGRSLVSPAYIPAGGSAPYQGIDYRALGAAQGRRDLFNQGLGLQVQLGSGGRDWRGQSVGANDTNAMRRLEAALGRNKVLEEEKAAARAHSDEQRRRREAFSDAQRIAREQATATALGRSLEARTTGQERGIEARVAAQERGIEAAAASAAAKPIPPAQQRQAIQNALEAREAEQRSYGYDADDLTGIEIEANSSDRLYRQWLDEEKARLAQQRFDAQQKWNANRDKRSALTLDMAVQRFLERVTPEIRETHKKELRDAKEEDRAAIQRRYNQRMFLWALQVASDYSSIPITEEVKSKARAILESVDVDYSGDPNEPGGAGAGPAPTAPVFNAVPPAPAAGLPTSVPGPQDEQNLDPTGHLVRELLSLPPSYLAEAIERLLKRRNELEADGIDVDESIARVLGG